MTETRAPYVTQREIKFRAWFPHLERMVSWLELKEQPQMLIDIFHGAPLESTVAGGKLLALATPMQFTGLKDKNGREIYEGDIVRSSKGFTEVVEWSQETGGVGEYSDFAAGFEFDGDEVIGNIHENQELMK